MRLMPERILDINGSAEPAILAGMEVYPVSDRISTDVILLPVPLYFSLFRSVPAEESIPFSDIIF